MLYTLWSILCDLTTLAVDLSLLVLLVLWWAGRITIEIRRVRRLTISEWVAQNPWPRPAHLHGQGTSPSAPKPDVIPSAQR